MPVTIFRPERATNMPSPKKPAKTKQPFMPPSPAAQTVALKRDVQALAREEGPASLATLVKLRDDETAPRWYDRVARWAILDRGCGKPVQTVNQRIIRSMADLTMEELEALIASGEAELEQEERGIKRGRLPIDQGRPQTKPTLL